MSATPCTWSLSGTDAALFDISNTGVITFKNAPDFEAPVGGDNIYNVTVQVSDGTVTDTQAVTVTVTDVNYAPTDIQLSNASVPEIAGGAIVGILSTTDIDAGDTHSYTVSDSRFEVVNGQLKLKDDTQLDYEAAPSVNVTVTSTDAGGASFAKQFAIAVSNVDEPNLATVSEGGLAAGPQIGVVNLGFSPSDTETVAFTVNHPIGATLTSDGVPLVYAVTSGTQAQLTAYKQGETVGQPVFTVTLSRFGHYSLGLYQNIDHIGDTTTLQFAVVREYFGTLTPMTLTVDIHDGVPSVQNDTAQVVTGSETIINVLANDGFGADGAHATTRIVNLAATHGTAEVTSDHKIRFVADADYSGPATVTYSIRDGDGDVSAPATVAITVKPVNHAPTDIALSSASVDENTPGAVIGTLSTTDVDGWDSHTYAVNDSRFEVVNGAFKLKSGQALDFEQGSPVNVTVTTTDSEGVSFAKQFAIAVGDVNEAPTDIVWNAQMPSAGNSFPQSGAVIANLAAVDPDGGDTFAYQLLAGISPDFTISESGVVTRTGSAMADGQTYTLNARVTDAAGETFDKTFEIHTGSGNADVMLPATAAGDDVFYAREGNDRLYGGGGSDTLFGQDGNDRLLADQAHVVTASVGNGVNGPTNSNQFVFAFDMAAAPGESIREIRIDLPADARFLGQGFAFGSGSSGLVAADVINVNSMPQGSSALVLRFADGVFGEGDVLSFGVDTVGSVEVGSHLVGKSFSVVFSDGTTLSSSYGAGDGGLAASRTAIDSLGQAGNDVLVGGLGNDTLVGGGGADTYRFAESGSEHRDTILDYSAAQGDKLDLSALLDANFGSGSNVSDFVRVLDSGKDATVQVDVDGAGGASTWTDVAVLANYNTSGNPVLVNFQNQTHQLVPAALVITSNNGDPLAVNVAENQTAVTTIVATDINGDTLTWSLSGTDAALFDISNAGVITFKNAPDFESPSDSGGNHVYDLIVSVSDGTVTDNQAIAVTVTNVAPSTPADVTPGGGVAENSANGTQVGITAASADPNGGTVTFTLTGNAGGRFAIDANTGIVTVANGALLDYEAGTSHQITVQASDGHLTSSQNFTIAVTNVTEPRLSINDVTVNEDAGTITFTVTRADPRLLATSVDYDVDSGTAQSYFDYEPGTNGLSGTLTFAPFEATKTITLALINNGGPSEGLETFTVKLSNPVNGMILTAEDGLGVGTIVDDEGPSPGDDTIVADQTAALIDDGGGGVDTLQVNSSFTSVSDAQLQNIELVLLTGAVTLNLANQTEGFEIQGSSGNDIITAGSGNDRIEGGGGNDTVNAGAGSDRIYVSDVVGNRQDFALLNGGTGTDALVLADYVNDNQTEIFGNKTLKGDFSRAANSIEVIVGNSSTSADSVLQGDGSSNGWNFYRVAIVDADVLMGSGGDSVTTSTTHISSGSGESTLYDGQDERRLRVRPHQRRHHGRSADRDPEQHDLPRPARRLLQRFQSRNVGSRQLVVECGRARLRGCDLEHCDGRRCHQRRRHGGPVQEACEL